MQRTFPYVVMLTGPVGSGKSDGSALAAKQLTEEGIHTAAISSGWIYRIYAHLSIVLDVDWETNGSQDLVEEMTGVGIAISPDGLILVDGHPLAVENLKTERVSLLTAKIAQVAAVRQLAQAKLNEVIASFPGEVVLVDGRDYDRSLYGELTVLGLVFMEVSDEKAAERTGETLEAVKERNARDAERLQLARDSADASFGTDPLTLEETAENIGMAVVHLLGDLPRKQATSNP